MSKEDLKDKKMCDMLASLSDGLQSKMVTDFLTERAMAHMMMPNKVFAKWVAQKETVLLNGLFSALIDNLAKFDVLSPTLAMGCIPRGVVITLKLNDINEWEGKRDDIGSKLEEMFKSVDKNMDEMIRDGRAPPRTKTKKFHSIRVD